MQTFVLLLGAAMAPGCAVLDGLADGDESERPSNGSSGGGDVIAAPDAGSLTIPGQDAQTATPQRLHVRLAPAVAAACQPDLVVSEFFIEQVSPDGFFNVTIEPFRIEGQVHPLRFDGIVLCNDIFNLEMEALFDVQSYRGSYVVHPDGTTGELEVVQLF